MKRFDRAHVGLPAALLSVALAGCEGGQAPNNAAQAPTPPPTAPAPVIEAPQVAPPPVKMVQDSANVELTKKGQAAARIGEGLISTPAKQYLRIPDRVAFEIQIPHALSLYMATNGEYPKTHEQFMKDIVEANQIKLPELPPDSKYVYDPESKQLMIEHPQ